ncbi:hypothetical protein AWB75_07128 [Caballeronia catudaia]|uniref:Uncharacterized protein n=1 Tax=Caballeronia catudaia TaxID=1777136 RepID=A0A158DSD4_9BURK|nr:hypothetical protein AWB75_07128 [Caballeronia catudaia]
MFGVKIERYVHRIDPRLRRRHAMQQMQEVSADGIVVGFDFDALAVMRVVIPVQQHRAERGHQTVGDILRARRVVIVLLGQQRAEHGDAGAHDVHRIRGRRNPFERGLEVRGQAAQSLQLRFISLQFGGIRQLAMHEQMRDFFELGSRRDIENVVAPIVQIVAGLADRAQRGIARRHARQRDGLLRLESAGRGCFGRCDISHAFKSPFVHARCGVTCRA